MPNPNDIPPELIHPEKSGAFVQWILSLPITLGVRRSLISNWSHLTGARLTTNQWKEIQRESTEP